MDFPETNQYLLKLQHERSELVKSVSHSREILGATNEELELRFVDAAINELEYLLGNCSGNGAKWLAKHYWIVIIVLMLSMSISMTGVVILWNR